MRSLVGEARGSLRRRLQVYGLIAAAFTFLPHLATVWYGFEITAHFRVQYAATLALIAGLLLALRMPRTAAVIAVVAVLNAAHFARDLVPRALPPTRGSELRLMSFNVLGTNPDVDGIVRAVAAADPDVLVVLELTSPVDAALRARLPALAPAALSIRTDNFGIGVYTRLTVRGARVHHFGNDPTPAVVASMALDDAPLTVIAVHPTPPVGDWALRRRNAVLLEAAQYATSIGTDAIVAGDFNATPWTPVFPAMLAKGLADSRAGFGLQRSWPDYSWILRVPIDHVLTTSGLVTLDRRIGEAEGSDHRPVVVRLTRRAD
jgi:endonuclease/exonuclease/phosphatase (EEP) superfamily protein YafD